MADGVTQLFCDLCHRLRSSFFWSPKSKNMSSVANLILASLAGVAVALIATYMPLIWRPLWRPSLESYAPGFNLVLAPQKALEEKSKLGFIVLEAYSYCLSLWNLLVNSKGATLTGSERMLDMNLTCFLVQFTSCLVRKCGIGDCLLLLKISVTSRQKRERR